MGSSPRISVDQAVGMVGGPLPATADPSALAAATTTLAPVTQPDAPVPSTKPRADRDALPLVAHGVEMVESGGKQDTISPKGAKGVMGLMPDTAKELRVDIDNEGQNREGGTRFLGQLYDKYGSWNDALAAYNAGPGKVDAWIAAGRPDSGKGALPEETKKYVPSVLGRAGLIDTPAQGLLTAKRRIDVDEALQLAPARKPVEEPPDTEAIRFGMRTDEDQVRAVTPEFAEQAGALVQGARRGLQNLVLGPVQVGLEMTAPEAAAQFTQGVNELEEKYGNAQLLRDHPVIATIGEAVGTGAGLLAAARFLGPITPALVIPKALSLVSRALLPAAGGAALGATTYNSDPENTSRVLEGVFGAIGGEVGRIVGNSASWAAKRLADKGTYNTFLKTLQDSVQAVGRNTAQPLANFLTYTKGLWAQNNRNYGARNLAGRAFEGFDSDILRGVVSGYANESRVNGVAVAPQAKTYANRVYEELGLRDEDAARAGSEQEIKAYQKERDDWEKQYATGVPTLYKDAILRRDIDSGRIPPPPDKPPPYAPDPISPSKFSAALTAVNRGLRQAVKDSAAVYQLTRIKEGLMTAAAGEAASMGMTVEVFLRRADQANKFYAENLGPLREIFGSANPAQLEKTITPAMFFDRVIKTIEGGDTIKLQTLARAVGPRGREDMKGMAIFQMLNKGQEPGKPFSIAKAVGWLRENQESLQTLFDRDGVENMLGWAKIADRVAMTPEKHRTWFAGTRSWLPFVGAEEIIQGAMHGRLERMALGGGMIIAPYASHALFTAINNMARVPAILPLVRAAGKMRSDSPQLEGLIKSIETKYRAYGLAAGREAAQEYAGEASPF